MGGILKAWHQESQCRAFFLFAKLDVIRIIRYLKVGGVNNE